MKNKNGIKAILIIVIAAAAFYFLADKEVNPELTELNKDIVTDTLNHEIKTDSIINRVDSLPGDSIHAELKRYAENDGTTNVRHDTIK